MRAFDFNTLHVPEDRDKLRFEQREGKLRNLLHRSVPELAANAVHRLWQQRCDRAVAPICGRIFARMRPFSFPHFRRVASRRDSTGQSCHSEKNLHRSLFDHVASGQ